jgi:hypothetical protein
MPKKSVVLRMEIQTVQRFHKCQYNDRHELTKNKQRLAIWTDGDSQNYCLPCGKSFITAGIQRLQELLTELDKILPKD